MACGMIVAPRMDAASSTESASANRGTRPPITPAGSGGATNTPTVKPTVMMTSSPMITNSNGRGAAPRLDTSSTIETAPVIRPPQMSGTPKSRLSATAPPMTSARSVAMATSSACSQ